MSFEGAGAYIGLGYEASAGVPGTIKTWIPFTSEDLGADPTRAPNPNITPRRATQRGRLLQVPVGGGLTSAPDAESVCLLRAHQQGYVETTESSPGAVWTHVMRGLLPGDSEPATYRRSIFAEVYRDDLAPERYDYGKVAQVQIRYQEAAYVQMAHQLLFTRLTKVDDPVEVANSSFTGSILVRGVPRAGLTEDIYIQCSTSGALDGTAKVKVKVGTGSTYDGQAYSVVAGKWFKIYDETDEPLGPSEHNNLEILFTAGGTLTADTDGSGSGLADEWTISPSRTILTPSFTQRNVYSGAQVVATVDAQTDYILNQIQVTGVTPRLQNIGLGSIFAQQVLDNGQVAWSIQINRKYVDLDFYDALLHEAEIAISIQMIGDEIGATGFRDSHTLQFANSQFDEAGTNVANANSLDEQIVLTAFDDGTDPICEETMVNTIASA